jgi:hypothetical protein
LLELSAIVNIHILIFSIHTNNFWCCYFCECSNSIYIFSEIIRKMKIKLGSQFRYFLKRYYILFWKKSIKSVAGNSVILEVGHTRPACGHALALTNPTFSYG